MLTHPQQTSLSDLAYAQLRAKILFHDLRAGEAINELSLAQDLGLGRTPIREAVLRLARERLLRVIPRKGIIVADLNIETLRMVFEARSPCEVQIARLAALRSDVADIAAMESSLADVERMIDERRFRDLLEADARFHTRLAEAARNPLLRETFSTVYGLGIRFWYATLAQRPSGDIKHEMRLHRDVLEGIKQRDPEKTAEGMMVIISGFPDRVMDLIRAPDLRSLPE